MYTLHKVFKITELREGAVYKTAHVASVWVHIRALAYMPDLNARLAAQAKIAAHFGGDLLQTTGKVYHTISEKPDDFPLLDSVDDLEGESAP